MKPFKETGLGKFLKEKAPHILEKIGDVLPDAGLFGVVKGLIGSDEKIDPAVKLQFATMEHEFQLELLKDVQSARNREVEFVKATGHMDRFMMVVGFFVMVVFGFCIYVTVYVPLEAADREMFLEVRATSKDAFMLIVGYYWGSSASSRIKDMIAKANK